MTDRDLADFARCYGTDSALGRELLVQVARRQLLGYTAGCGDRGAGCTASGGEHTV